MADAHHLAAPIVDGVERSPVTFDCDVSTGIVTVGVRPRYGLEGARVSAPIPIFEFLELAATIQATVAKLARAHGLTVGRGAT